MSSVCRLSVRNARIVAKRYAIGVGDGTVG